MGRTGAISFLVLCSCGRIDFALLTDAASGSGVPHCENAIRDADETGIDCGGSCVAGCPGATCSGDADCVTASCVGGHCELASGPPSWLPGPPLGTARGYLQSAVDDSGVMFAVGGSTSLVAAGSVRTVEQLAPGTTSWSPAPSLVIARSLHAVAAVGGTVFAYGGVATTGGGLMSIERYAGTWSLGTPSSGTNSAIAGAGGIDGRLYVADNSSIPIYSPALDSWSTLPTPATPRDEIGVTRGSDGWIYIVGGRVGGTTLCMPACMPSPVVDALDPQSLTWTARAPMQTMRVFLAAVAAPDGRIYASGGANTSELPSVEAYTPSSDRWTNVAPLQTARAGHGAAVSLDGRIYVIGGASSGGALASVEVYGPVLTLGATAGAAGTPVAITATNFAANAALAVTFDNAPVAVATSDASGNAAATFTIPSLPAGTYTVSAVDNKSQYPVQLTFQIQ